MSLREQLQFIEELPKYSLVLGTTWKSKIKKKTYYSFLEWVPKIHIPSLVFINPSPFNCNEIVKKKNQVDI